MTPRIHPSAGADHHLDRTVALFCQISFRRRATLCGAQYLAFVIGHATGSIQYFDTSCCHY
jgi:hypothetical protein